MYSSSVIRWQTSVCLLMYEVVSLQNMKKITNNWTLFRYEDKLYTSTIVYSMTEIIYTTFYSRVHQNFHTHTLPYTYTSIHVHFHTHALPYTYTSIHVHFHTRALPYTCTSIHMHFHTHALPYTCTFQFCFISTRWFLLNPLCFVYA